jgi:hypothetical protein
MSARKSKLYGFGTTGWLAAIPAGLIAAALLALGFYESRKAYWDSKVSEMCAKDGGVKVVERIVVTDEEFKRLGGDENGLPIPFSDDSKRKDYPYFREARQSQIKEGNPEVVRSEVQIKRRSDGKVLVSSVSYWRRGGDMPSGLFHDSSYVCPQKPFSSKAIVDISRGSK